VPPAAHQRASTGHAGHPVVVSTAACGRRLGGGPAPDGLFTGLIRAPERTGDTSPRHIPRPTSLRANHCVPSSVVACARLPGHGWPTPSGAVILLITGAISLLGPRSGKFGATHAFFRCQKAGGPWNVGSLREYPLPLCRKLCMSGSYRPSLAIRDEKQARLSPTPNGGARVYAH